MEKVAILWINIRSKLNSNNSRNKKNTHVSTKMMTIIKNFLHRVYLIFVNTWNHFLYKWRTSDNFIALFIAFWMLILVIFMYFAVVWWVVKWLWVVVGISGSIVVYCWIKVLFDEREKERAKERKRKSENEKLRQEKVKKLN